MEILQNQAYMTRADAEQRTRQIFDAVEYDRQVRNEQRPQRNEQRLQSGIRIVFVPLLCEKGRNRR